MTELELRPLRSGLQQLNHLVRETFARAAQTDNLPNGFLGTMPMTMSRRHIRMVKSYVRVARKPRQHSKTLFSIKDLDTSAPDPNILQPPTRENPKPLRQDRTLLDGELTLNLITNQYEFLVYDIICLDGDASIAQMDYRKRLILAENFITYPRCFSSHASGSLRLRVKDFYEKKDIKHLFAKISKDHEGEYVYSNGHRKDGPICNHNDGCIFAPVQMSYQLKTCSALLKWKPPHLNSVDFQLILEPVENGGCKTHIAYQGDGGIVKLREVIFPGRQKAEWMRNFDQTNHSIIECSYDRGAGEWRYIRAREDKDKPNYSTTVIDTLESTAEEVTRHELMAEISRSRQATDAGNHKRLIFTEDYDGDRFSNEDEHYLRTMPISTVPMPIPIHKQQGRHH